MSKYDRRQKTESISLFDILSAVDASVDTAKTVAELNSDLNSDKYKFTSAERAVLATLQHKCVLIAEQHGAFLDMVLRSMDDVEAEVEKSED
ncbi:MAG: hypothetical protein WC505_07045 [Patescibacteria group bacterium]